MLAENVEGIANATETVEMLNQAQENLRVISESSFETGVMVWADCKKVRLQVQQ